MKIEIELKNNPEHFKELYFRENQGNYFLSAAIKKQFIVLCILIVLEIVVNTVFPGNGLLIGPVSIALAICFGYYLYAAFYIWKWKREVYEFLKSENAKSEFQLILTDNSFSFRNDKTEHIEKWEIIKSIDITPEYISISGKQEYLILKKSVSSEAYELIKKTISEKVK
jgi:hypothetical protein